MDEIKCQETKPSFWAVLPASVRYDPQLPAGAKLLYAEISALTEAKGYCYAGNDYFVKLFGMAERTLQRQLNALQAGGYIKIIDGTGGKARRKIFAGINPLAENPDKNVGVDAEPRQKCRGNPDENVGDIENNKNNKNPPTAPHGGGRVRSTPKKAPDYEPEIFARFWAAYPRGEDKQGAICAWDALHPDRELMLKMSAALSTQKASEEWKRGVGIPYAVRWLKNRRWEDVEKQTPGTPPQAAAGDEEGLPWI